MANNLRKLRGGYSGICITDDPIMLRLAVAAAFVHLLIFQDAVNAFVLTPSPTDTEVVPGMTSQISLTCAKNPSQPDFDEVVTIRIAKQDADGTWSVYAKVTGASSVVTVVPNGAKASGNINTNAEMSYLKLEWPLATDETLGVYRCDILGYDTALDWVEERTPEVEITERKLSPFDILDILNEDRENNEKTFNDLKDMISNISDTNPDLSDLDARVGDLENKTADFDQRLQELEEAYFSQWPEGSYGILKPDSGCPYVPAFYYGSQSSMEFPSPAPADSPALSTSLQNSHLSTPVVGTSVSNPTANVLSLRFCFASVKQRSLLWPKGNYCIYKYGGETCPLFFLHSSFVFPGVDKKSDKFASFKDQLNFCCRNDGSYAEEIRLPNAYPFYLFRRISQCQKVIGMSVQEEHIFVSSNQTISGGNYPSTSYDFRNQGLRFDLCYYTPSP